LRRDWHAERMNSAQRLFCHAAIDSERLSRHLGAWAFAFTE
jgi:hypothetical protein